MLTLVVTCISQPTSVEVLISHRLPEGSAPVIRSLDKFTITNTNHNGDNQKTVEKRSKVWTPTLPALMMMMLYNTVEAADDALYVGLTACTVCTREGGQHPPCRHYLITRTHPCPFTSHVLTARPIIPASLPLLWMLTE